MSEPKQKTPSKRIARPTARVRLPTRVDTQGGHDKALVQASASGEAPPPADARVVAPDDPKIEGIVRVLEVMGNRMD